MVILEMCNISNVADGPSDRNIKPQSLAPAFGNDGIENGTVLRRSRVRGRRHPVCLSVCLWRAAPILFLFAIPSGRRHRVRPPPPPPPSPLLRRSFAQIEKVCFSALRRRRRRDRRLVTPHAHVSPCRPPLVRVLAVAVVPTAVGPAGQQGREWAGGQAGRQMVPSKMPRESRPTLRTVRSSLLQCNGEGLSRENSFG